MLNLKLANLGTAHILLVGGSTKSISVYPHGMGKKQPTYLSSSIVEKIDLYLFTKRWKKKKLLLKVYMMQKNILLRIISICTMTKSFFFPQALHVFDDGRYHTILYVTIPSIVFLKGWKFMIIKPSFSSDLSFIGK